MSKSLARKYAELFDKKRGTVVEIRLEPKADLELAIAIAQKARKITEEENG